MLTEQQDEIIYGVVAKELEKIESDAFDYFCRMLLYPEEITGKLHNACRRIKSKLGECPYCS